MKKIYLLLAATAVLGACSESDVIKEVVENEVAIGFNGGFVDNATKAISGNNHGEMNATLTSGVSEGTLCTDGNTIEVWGWKTTKGTSTNTKIFDNQTVTYTASSTQSTTKWVYTPLKYWDKTASYKFYATAPKGAFTMPDEDDATPTDRKFQATDIPAVQVLINKDCDNLIKTAYNTDTDVPGTASTAIDYLVADVVACSAGAANQGNDATDKDVDFTFKHILSKLNVNVKTTDAFNNSGEKYPQIKLTKLTLSFGEYTPATESTSASWSNLWYDTNDKYQFDQTTAGAVMPFGGTNPDTWTITDDDNSAVASPTDNSYISFQEDESTTATGSTPKVAKQLLSTTAATVASYFVAPTDQTKISSSAVNHVYVTAEYEITYLEADNTTKTVEKCVSEMTEVTKPTSSTDTTPVPAFPSFVQNNVYTLDVVIGPRAIYFDVEVAGWTDGATGTVTVE